jgi:benzoyl-CoA reductase/2-hydroxyglutaryl-CoA dehydratase subunit BcrC/BadD/HgdB
LAKRDEYIDKEKKEKGKKLFGIFPSQYPREILWAMNVLPVEIWDPPLEVIHANAHLQPYICSVVRLGLELILQGKCEGLDGFLFPHTCDSIQNLSSIVYDYLGVKKSCYFFYHPKSPYKDSSRV